MEKNTLKALQLCPLFEGFTAKDIEQMMDNIPYLLLKVSKKEVFKTCWFTIVLRFYLWQEQDYSCQLNGKQACNHP